MSYSAVKFSQKIFKRLDLTCQENDYFSSEMHLCKLRKLDCGQCHTWNLQPLAEVLAVNNAYVI